MSTCRKPYSKKIQNNSSFTMYTKKESPYSSKEAYTKVDNPYDEFCIGQFLKIDDNNFFSIGNNSLKLKIN